MTFAAQERAALCDRLDELGPQAPTLCSGWATQDLAAHLVVRERRPTALPGIVLGGSLAARTRRVTERLERDVDYPGLVRLLRSGPPLLPLGLPGTEDLAHLHELFVHHEDVRRATGEGPRTLSPRLSAALWSRLGVFAPVLLRRVPVGVELVEPGGDTLRGHRGEPAVRLRGDPGELLLYVFGRRATARVEVEGSADAVGRLEAADLRA